MDSSNYGPDCRVNGEIVLHLDRLMTERGISLGELAEKIGMTNANVSKIKNNHVTAMRFSTLAALCEILDCEVGDLIEFIKKEEVKHHEQRTDHQEAHGHHRARRGEMHDLKQHHRGSFPDREA